MKKILVIASTIFAHTAFAQNSYLCIPDGTTGFVMNSKSQRWENAPFNTSGDKMILKKSSNSWIWSSFGSSSGLTCNKDFDDKGDLSCQTMIGELKFNKKSLRYIETSTVGYYQGDKAVERNPFISIGRCAPL